MLCNKTVQFIIRHDKSAKIKFAALQSDITKQLLSPFDISKNDLTTILYLKNNIIHDKSSAAIEIAKDLGGIWKIFTLSRIIPKAIRDGIYMWVSRNRFKWFGRTDSCIIPDADINKRFIN